MVANRFQSLSESLLNDLHAATAPVTSRHKAAITEAADEAVNQNNETSVKVDMTNNPFFKLVKNNELTDTKKSEGIRDLVMSDKDALSLREEDIKALNETFGAFEKYYTNLQDNALDTDLDAVRELMDRIKNAIAPKCRKCSTA